MPLVPGVRFGAYEIVAALGAGGMGEVYRARDATLHRDVALKVLPAALANDLDRLARFQREAQILASLNHPNIAIIHGLEQGIDARALVMELVDGSDLSQQIGRGALPIEEALPIALQIADALEAAHDQGIIHRDLKPANIKLRGDGRVKVLDFGLAKAMDPVGSLPSVSQSPTITSPAMTATGVILGTAAYMSPEQARGKAVDTRTDIWAFGCVLYELLTARRAFKGETVSDTIAAILEREPDWEALPVAARPYASVLRRCLEKDPKRRLRDIGDVKHWLEDAAARPLAPLPAGRSSAGRWVGIAALLGVLAGGAAAGLLLRSRSQTAPPRVGRFELASSQSHAFTAEPFGINLAISPDGSRVVYTTSEGGVTRLAVRRLDRLKADPIEGSEGGGQPFFSPDGRQIGFATLVALKRVPAEGGASVTICPVTAGLRGATWGADDSIVFANDGSVGLLRIKVGGGAQEKLFAPDGANGEENFVQPTILPGGALLYTVLLHGGQTRIVARKLGSRDVTTIAEGGVGARFLPQGFVVFGQGDRLMAVRFNPATLQVTGSPVVVQEDAFTKVSDGVANISAAADGTMVYVAGHNAGTLRRLVWVDRSGTRVAAAMEDLVDSARNPRLSPDGRRLALTVGRSGRGDIWVYDMEGAAQPLKLTFEEHNTFPSWSPDGKRIVFMSVAKSGAHMFSIAADGSSPKPERMTAGTSMELPFAWSPDGAFVLFTNSEFRLWLLHAADRTTRRWLQTPFNEFGGSFSPSGRWVAYASNQTGALEVWVRPFPGPGAPVRISSEGGHDPVWARDEKEIFYQNGPRLLSARIAFDASGLRAEAPRALFAGYAHDDDDANIRYFDVGRDGRLLMIEPIGVAKPASIVVVQQFEQELNGLVPAK